MRHREKRRTRAAQQRNRNLGLSLKPALHDGEKRKIFKDGAFQIIYENLVSKFLFRIVDAGKFLRVAPARISRCRSHTESRLEQDKIKRHWKRRRLDDFALPATDGGAAVQEEWNIGADQRGQFIEFFRRKIRGEQFVQPAQRRRGIAAATAKPSAMRNVFLERDGDAWRNFRLAKKSARRPHHKIVFAGRKRWIVTLKLKLISDFYAERIMQCDRRDHGFDFVEVIIAPVQNAERKIDFGVRSLLHHLPSVDEFAHIDEMKSSRDRLIVALDVGTRAEAISLALALAPFARWMKLGLQLFTAEGPDLVRAIRETGANVFLDLKLHDIPTTVARAVESATKLEVGMLTLHLMGGREMIRAAVEAAPSSLLLLGVTVLTSANDETLRAVGINADVARQATRLAKLGSENGVRGLVASAHEIAAIRKAAGDEIKLVVPGIRPRDSQPDDQKRTVTPAEAIAAGADYLVIGRPITGAPDPAASAQKILEELED